MHYAMNYYYDILPIYDYTGTLLNPKMINKTGKNSYKLKIHETFVHLLGLKHYYSRYDDTPNIDKLNKQVKDCIEYINNNVIILLTAHIAFFDKEYEIYYLYNNELLEKCKQKIENILEIKYETEKHKAIFNNNIELDQDIKEKILDSNLAINYGFSNYDKFIKNVLYNKVIKNYDYIYADEDKHLENRKFFIEYDIIFNYIIGMINMEEHILKSMNFIHNNNINDIIKKIGRAHV